VTFKKHYTREEARALLPQVQLWLEKLRQLRDLLEKSEERLESLRSGQADLGGELVNRWIRNLSEMRELLLEFHRREIQLKDLDRGLVDFPAVIGGKEVFLCWERTEADIEFWHDLDSGYAGREPL
jgi:hypothetical protein